MTNNSEFIRLPKTVDGATSYAKILAVAVGSRLSYSDIFAPATTEQVANYASHKPEDFKLLQEAVLRSHGVVDIPEELVVTSLGEFIPGQLGQEAVQEVVGLELNVEKAA